MKVKGNFIMREIGGDYILVPTGDSALQFGGLMTTNEVGSFIWEQLTNDISLEELAIRIVEEFEIDEETAREDAKEFIEKLRKLNLVE